MTDAATHRRLLDAFGGLEADADNVETLWEARRAAYDAADSHRAEVERAQRESDWLRHAVDELDKLAPQPGEETALATRRTIMMQSEKVAEDLRDAYDALAGSNSSVPALAAVIRRLERRATQAPTLVEPSVKSLDAALNCAGRNARPSRGRPCAPPISIRPNWNATRNGCSRCARPARKYNVQVDDLAALARKYNDDIALIDAGEAKLKTLVAACAKADADFRAAATALSQARAKAAAKLDKAVNGELAPLKLERAKFSTQIETDAEAAGPNGIDRVEFWVQTNPGTKPGPLMKIASGGELARFLLALKVVLADRGSAPTLVFDEIDTGVGGAVADAIGLRLAKLGRNVQVLAVTHAPQVAARADRHYVISKDALDKGKRVATRVIEVAEDHRREEIARMLAGAEITNEARAAAERLIKAAS